MLSIIVAWRDRHQLAQALPSLRLAAELTQGDLTIVNYSGSRQLLRNQLGEGDSAIRIVNVPGEQYFNKARAQNIGAAHASNRLLFFCDCDIVLDPEPLSCLCRKLDECPGHFGTLAGVRESETNSRGGKHVISFGYELKIRTADGRSLSIIDSEEDAETGTRQAPGLLVVRQSDFLAINGYNGNLQGWGWEDQDMIARLTLGQGLTRISEGYALHLSHDDNARTQYYPPVSNRWESRDRMFRTALSNYDRSDFSGTYVSDASSQNSQQEDLT
jgi:N-terminal domain of galactosyltransferase